ncbi:hypothetical protein [Nocardioides sp. J54]|uniref:hypothetical protein n=1 Tax=Nocardioides sp. J54 TaxID=935866 RepID=UPI0006858AA1|nr:hypothetical protein [Nocardioides sp. J54]
MTNGSDVRVEGLAAAVRQLQALGVDLEDLRAAFTRIASEAVPTYQRFTPVRSGRLRGNYRASKTKNRVALLVGGGAVPYARVINYGWPKRNIAAADFVAKGDVVTTPKALEAIEADINRLIRSM